MSAHIEALRSMCGWRMPPGEGEAINAALDAAIAALAPVTAEDTARLDWLDAQRNDDVHTEYSSGERTLVGCYWNVSGQYMDVRAAIDAAIMPSREQGEGS